MMVLPSGYYAGALRKSRAALVVYFVDVAVASPLPVVMYNFPGVSGGIDVDEEMVVGL